MPFEWKAEGAWEAALPFVWNMDCCTFFKLCMSGLNIPTSSIQKVNQKKQHVDDNCRMFLNCAAEISTEVSLTR